MQPVEIDLSVDELVLDGLPLTDRRAFRSALRSALQKALSQPATLALLGRSARDRSRIDGADMTLSRGDAASVGEALAAAIVSALCSNAARRRGPGAP